MPTITPLDVCYVCKEKATIQNLGTSFLVDCPQCGAYEIEAVATTMDLKDRAAVLAYLANKRDAGSVRPLIFRELFSKAPSS